jgi:hypothetical protein
VCLRVIYGPLIASVVKYQSKFSEWEIMNQAQQNLKFALILALSLTSMIACSPKDNSFTPAANAAATTTVTSTTTETKTKVITSCSKDVAGNTDLGMNLQVYSRAGVKNTNLIRVRFSSFPSNFSNDSSALVFWANSTDSNGNPTTPNQIPFYIEQYSGSGSFKLLSAPIYSVTWQQLATLAANNSISNKDAATALKSMTFLVDINAFSSSTILTASLYTAGITASSTPDRNVKALIPEFYADPNDYLASHNETLLGLHPFRTSLSANLSSSEYATMSQQLCF